MPTISCHVESALYADDTVVIATSRQPALLFSYMDSYLSDVERWRSSFRRHILKPLPVQLFGEPVLWLDAACYLGVTLDRRLTWSSHIDRFRKGTAQRLGALGPLLYRSIGLAIRNGFLLYKQHIRPMVYYGCPI
jgi:hypothetical protein